MNCSPLGLFDAYSLFNAIHTTPANFLNGTVPFNVTGAINSCVYEVNGGPVGGSCPPPQVRQPCESLLGWILTSR